MENFRQKIDEIRRFSTSIFREIASKLIEFQSNSSPVHRLDREGRDGEKKKADDSVWIWAAKKADQTFRR